MTDKKNEDDPWSSSVHFNTDTNFDTSAGFTSSFSTSMDFSNSWGSPSTSPGLETPSAPTFEEMEEKPAAQRSSENPRGQSNCIFDLNESQQEPLNNCSAASAAPTANEKEEKTAVVQNREHLVDEKTSAEQPWMQNNCSVYPNKNSVAVQSKVHGIVTAEPLKVCAAGPMHVQNYPMAIAVPVVSKGVPVEVVSTAQAAYAYPSSNTAVHPETPPRVIDQRQVLLNNPKLKICTKRIMTVLNCSLASANVIAQLQSICILWIYLQVLLPGGFAGILPALLNMFLTQWFMVSNV